MGNNKFCPYCGKKLQENAQYCIYCMRSLVKKQDQTPNLKKKKTFIIPVIAVIACIAVILVFVFVNTGDKANDVPEDTQNTVEDTPNERIITTFDDYQKVARALTKRNGLDKYWNVNSFVLTHSYTDDDNDVWDLYSPDILIDGVHMRLGFCEKGIEVFSLFCGITDDTLDDTLNLIEASLSSVYNFTFSNLHDTLTDHITYPIREEKEENTYIFDIYPNDPFAQMTDEGTAVTYHRKVMNMETNADNDIAVIEFRTRIFNGKEVYDILTIHLQDE